MKHAWFLRVGRIRNRGLRIAAIAAMVVTAFALAVTAVGYIFMSLWNWLTPAVFGAPPVTFWQALGLIALTRILIGGLHGPRAGGGRDWRRRMTERWEKMTPEQREKFRQGWRGCGMKIADSGPDVAKG